MALYGSNLVTYPEDFRWVETLELQRVDRPFETNPESARRNPGGASPALANWPAATSSEPFRGDKGF
jgi:hypothetical protein